MALVVMTCETQDAEIRYTLDGTDPTASSSLFTEPFNASGVTVKARGFKSGLTPSDIATEVIPSEGPISWHKISQSVLADGVTAIVFGGDKWVIGGKSGKMAYSTDGLTWAPISQSLLTGQIKFIAYGNGKFVAVDSASNSAYSTDGLTWTRITQSAIELGLLSVFFGAGKFISDGISIDPGSGMLLNVMAYSTDAITWTAIQQTAFSDDSASLYVVAAGNSFVASGQGGNSYRMERSPDGLSWTIINTISIQTYVDALCYGAGKFLAGDRVGNLAYSIDGKYWDSISQSAISGRFYSAAYVNSLFMLGGADGKLAYSSDGLTWTPITQGSLSGNILSICHGAGKYIALDSTGAIAYCAS